MMMASTPILNLTEDPVLFSHWAQSPTHIPLRRLSITQPVTLFQKKYTPYHQKSTWSITTNHLNTSSQEQLFMHKQNPQTKKSFKGFRDLLKPTILEILTMEAMSMGSWRIMSMCFQKFAEQLLHKVVFQMAATKKPSITRIKFGPSESWS